MVGVATLASPASARSVSAQSAGGAKPVVAAGRTVAVNVVDKKSKSIYLVTVDLQTGAKRRISDRAGDPETKQRSGKRVLGAELAGVVHGTAPWALASEAGQLWAMPLDGGQHQKISPSGVLVQSPVLVSADGGVVLFGSGERTVTKLGPSVTTAVDFAADAVGMSPAGDVVVRTEGGKVLVRSTRGGADNDEKSFVIRCEDATVPVSSVNNALCFDSSVAGGLLRLVNLNDGSSTEIVRGATSEAVSEFGFLLAPSGRRGAFARNGALALWSIDGSNKVSIRPLTDAGGPVTERRLQSLAMSPQRDVAYGVLEGDWIAEVDLTSGAVKRTVRVPGAAAVFALG
jgi:hypothetical protein